jgi:hypothetical protein
VEEEDVETEAAAASPQESDDLYRLLFFPCEMSYVKQNQNEKKKSFVRGEQKSQDTNKYDINSNTRQWERG